MAAIHMAKQDKKLSVNSIKVERKLEPKMGKQKGMIFHPTLGYAIPPPMPVSVARRNARERSRVKNVNSGFELLRQNVPSAARSKKMSKVDTLRHAVNYIRNLQHLLSEGSHNDLNQSVNTSVQFSQYSPSPLYNQSPTPATPTSSFISTEEESGYGSPTRRVESGYGSPTRSFSPGQPVPSQPNMLLCYSNVPSQPLSPHHSGNVPHQVPVHVSPLAQSQQKYQHFISDAHRRLSTTPVLPTSLECGVSSSFGSGHSQIDNVEEEILDAIAEWQDT